MNRYLAQAQFKKALDKGAASISDVVFHNQLHVRLSSQSLHCINAQITARG